MRTRRGFKVAGLLVLLAITAFSWFSPGLPGDPSILWAVRLVASFVTVVMAIYLARSGPDEPTHKVRLREVMPADDVTCPFCNMNLIRMPLECYCPGCQVKRL